MILTLQILCSRSCLENHFRRKSCIPPPSSSSQRGFVPHPRKPELTDRDAVLSRKNADGEKFRRSCIAELRDDGGARAGNYMDRSWDLTQRMRNRKIEREPSSEGVSAGKAVIDAITAEENTKGWQPAVPLLSTSDLLGGIPPAGEVAEEPTAWQASSDMVRGPHLAKVDRPPSYKQLVELEKQQRQKAAGGTAPEGTAVVQNDHLSLGTRGSSFTPVLSDDEAAAWRAEAERQTRKYLPERLRRAEEQSLRDAHRILSQSAKDVDVQTRDAVWRADVEEHSAGIAG